MSKQKCICLFGGTFDPIHKGHTHIAQTARRELNLDEVIVLPCRQSPHKSGLDHAGDHHRLAMCQLATTEMNGMSVDDHDLISPGPSYSWATVQAMQKRFPDARLFWLMGTDQWEALPRWSRPGYLASMVEFIVFSRGSAPASRPDYRMHNIAGEHPASATKIRKAIRDHQTQTIQDWLDRSVWEYIKTHQLYQDDTSYKAND